MRWRHPERTRLKNRLRHVLTHDARLALWQTPAGTACGPAAARGTTTVLPELELPAERVTAKLLDRAHPADAIAAVFEAAPRPILFETLVRAMVAMWSVSEMRETDPSLTMRPMGSVLRVRRESPDPQTVTKRLNVDVVLEGQFSMAQDLVRVTLQLIDTRSGHAMWSESIEGRRGNLLGLVVSDDLRSAGSRRTRHSCTKVITVQYRINPRGSSEIADVSSALS